MPPFELNSPTITTRRPSSLKGWFDPSHEEKDPLIALKERFVELNDKVKEADELAAKHVYRNPDLSMIDVRQHRFMLHYLLYKAEGLALDFEILMRPEETVTYVTFLDGEIQRLEKIFQDWHGDPEADPGIPESFKQAMREVKAGQTEAMEEDMFAADAAPEV